MTIVMKMHSIRGEIVLSAADHDLVGREIRDGKLHLKVAREFYGDVSVSRETYVSSLKMCTIANLVGRETVGIAIEEEIIDPENVIEIGGVPHAQYASLNL